MCNDEMEKWKRMIEQDLHLMCMQLIAASKRLGLSMHELHDTGQRYHSRYVAK